MNREPEHDRNIVSHYYADTHGKKLVKSNRAKHAEHACELALRHLRHNHYDAAVCEVFDEIDGTLHAVLRRHKGGEELTVVYKREVQDEQD